MSPAPTRSPARQLILSATILMGLILFSGCAKTHKSHELRTSDPQMGKLAQQAKQLFEMERPAQAIPLYQAALNRARALNDDGAISQLAYNLGACWLDNGNALRASGALEEGIQAARAAGLPEENSRLLLGHALLKQGHTERTSILCGQAIEAMGPQGDLEMVMRFQLLNAEACLKTGQDDKANEIWRKVTQGLSPQSPHTIQAQAAHLEAVLLARQAQPIKSADAFLQEARLWGMTNQPRDVVTALIQAADQQQNAEDIPAEADSRYRAARALLGLARHTEAAAQLNRLDTLPKNKWPDSLSLLVPLLRLEINEHMPEANRKTALP
ncbi:MAG: hypothetical protein GY809_08875 [Planctomycetes bacterium]|nr:hypothetical protein [Planctomycetota bacterium]